MSFLKMNNFQKLHTPCGWIYVVEENEALTDVVFANAWSQFGAGPKTLVETSTNLLQNAAEQLDQYFAGRRTRFDLPLKFRGTPFEIEAWQQLDRIPYGSTVTYGAQAAAIGRPKAVRAVGRANGRNNLPIIIPCHRVIGSTGSLTGYSGGIEIKTFLLAHEAQHI
jgi:methylated-DNA-[protein]-cysteine S-methyltransferase